MTSEPILDVRDLTKIYPDGTRAVQGVSFQVARGEFFGFLGPNGVMSLNYDSDEPQSIPCPHQPGRGTEEACG